MIKISLGTLIQTMMLAGIGLVLGWWLLAIWADRRAASWWDAR